MVKVYNYIGEGRKIEIVIYDNENRNELELLIINIK